MINVAHYKAAIAEIPGEAIVMPRTQIAELLSEVELGQHARRALTNLKALTAVAASVSGAPA